MAGRLADRTPNTDVLTQLKGLPEELLVYILVFLTKAPGFRQAEMLGPSHVCRHWYNVVWSAQSLWRQIDFSSSHPLIKAILAANTSGPLDVRCIVNDAHRVKRADDSLFNGEILRVCDRVESLIWDRPFMPLSRWQLPPFPIPNVRKLTLIVHPSVQSLEPATPNYDLTEGVNIDELYIENVRLSPWSSPRLTTLRLLWVHDVPNIELSAEVLRKILSSSKNLVSLRLAYLQIQDEASRDREIAEGPSAIEAPSLIDMSQLQDLVLIAIPNQYAEILVHSCSFSPALVNAMFDQAVADVLQRPGPHGELSPFQQQAWSLLPENYSWGWRHRDQQLYRASNTQLGFGLETDASVVS